MWSVTRWLQGLWKGREGRERGAADRGGEEGAKADEEETEGRAQEEKDPQTGWRRGQFKDSVLYHFVMGRFHISLISRQTAWNWLLEISNVLFRHFKLPTYSNWRSASCCHGNRLQYNNYNVLRCVTFWGSIFFLLSLQGALSDNEEDSALADLKDLEFKLLHDLTQLQVATPVTEPNLVSMQSSSFFLSLHSLSLL